MQQHGSKYSARSHPPHPPPPDHVRGVKMSNSFFQNMVMVCQIKWNHECSNIVANILPARPSGCGVKRSNSTFSEYGHVTYQI